jgi:hypothetical protein
VFAGLEPPGIPERLEGGDGRRRDRRCSLERDRGRLRDERRRRYGDVLGEAAESVCGEVSEDLVARLKVSDVPADCFDSTSDVDAPGVGNFGRR